MLEGDPGYGLALAIVVAAVYLVVLRLVDLNEREPFWALALALFVGSLGGAILPVIVGSKVLTLEVVGGAVASEVGRFLAIAAVLVILAAIGRLRGWSEVNGVMDGVVYGAAVGLGFAVGDAFYQEAAFGTSIGADPSSFETLWTTALDGLSAGLFGAVIGAGYGIGLQGRSRLEQVGYPVAGLAVAILVHIAYTELGQGNSLGGNSGEIRAWLALLLPLAFVVGAAVWALGRERRAIIEELADEAASGTVTEEELGLLTNTAARRGRYARHLLSGDLDGWIALRALQNRQVQLALTERNSRRATDSERRADFDAQAGRLRAAILAAREDLERAVDTPRPATGGD